MSKKAQPKISSSQIKKQSSAKASVNGLLDKLEIWFENRDKKIFYILLFCSTLFSLLLFDAKVTLGGDDSAYIQRAWDFLKEGKFPYFQGPGYPLILSLFVKLFGLNIIALKFLSVLCQFGFVWVTYITFRKRIPYTVLFALIAFISFNHFFQYYASQTFTETFFLFVQSICLYITFKIIDNINSQAGFIEDIKQNYGKWILFGLMFVLLAISKSVAFVTLAGVVFYFLLKGNYKQIVFVVISFFLFRTIYQLLTKSIYGANDTDQFEMMLRKDLYKPNGGHEDFSGMVDRFFANFNTYISWHMYRIMNLRLITNINVLDSDTIKLLPPLSFLSTILLGIFSFLSFKKNKYVFFSSIYLIALAGGIFLGVQANNLQSRLIIIAMPLIFLVMFYGAYTLVKRSSFAQSLFVFFSAIMLIITIGKSSVTAKENIASLKKNMAGDMYYGYTPDWVNFLQMSKYCADSLPDSSYVVSRKPNMSFIYGNGKKFVGQYIVNSDNADTILMEWKKQKVEYVIMGNLRMNPKKNNGRVINTIQRMLSSVYQKYPQKIHLKKSIGEDEKCELYSIEY